VVELLSDFLVIGMVAAHKVFGSFFVMVTRGA